MKDEAKGAGRIVLVRFSAHTFRRCKYVDQRVLFPFVSNFADRAWDLPPATVPPHHVSTTSALKRSLYSRP